MYLFQVGTLRYRYQSCSATGYWALDLKEGRSYGGANRFLPPEFQAVGNEPVGFKGTPCRPKNGATV